LLEGLVERRMVGQIVRVTFMVHHSYPGLKTDRVSLVMNRRPITDLSDRR